LAVIAISTAPGGNALSPDFPLGDGSVDTGRTVPIYRLRDTTGDDLGLLEHPAANLEPGDVVVVADGREAIVTARS